MVDICRVAPQRAGGRLDDRAAVSAMAREPLGSLNHPDEVFQLSGRHSQRQ